MPESSDVTLTEAARGYLESLSDGDRSESQAEVQRFVRWCGADRPCGQLHAQEVANYAETLSGSVTGASRRAQAVKKFLAFAKKSGYTSTNLGTHLRLRKSSANKSARRSAAPLEEIAMSAEQQATVEAELESFKAQRPQIRDDLQRAMADKDFRENAPLDAARDRQGYVEGRIRELEATLAQAVIVEERRNSPVGVADIGSTVHLRNLQSDAEIIYTLVRTGETNAAEGRISFESPMGQALLKRRAGDEVEVDAPSGTLRFRIERVES